ncbi:unnamed protein product [Amaranthus hypochondriacus]
MSRIFNLIFFIFTIYIAKLGFSWACRPEKLSWAKTEPYGHELKTHLEFYFHEISIGDSATVALIAQAQDQPKESSSVFPFGNLYMLDEWLTVGPEPSSKLLGRAQGFSGSASQESVSSMMGLTYSFTDGMFNGSSFVILGRNELLNPVKELPVIGGTGLFRMARGFALARTYYFNVTLGVVIVGYNVTIFHPNIPYS